MFLVGRFEGQNLVQWVGGVQKLCDKFPCESFVLKNFTKNSFENLIILLKIDLKIIN